MSYGALFRLDPTTRVGVLTGNAESALDVAKNETTRAPVTTVRRKKVLDAFITAIRDIKRRYFLSLFLMDSNFASLGLKPHDNTHTATGVPTDREGCGAIRVQRQEKTAYFAVKIKNGGKQRCPLF
ncbi:MAG: hypothetical protein LBH85_09580 [Treponema sp.]|jgi:hypothetical protein|nr:hypothetical protein [Treponema sp.]